MTIDDLRARYDGLNAEVERLREDADRARWCQETKAQVSWSIIKKAWLVLWDSDIHGYRQVSHADRNAAIDAARGKV